MRKRLFTILLVAGALAAAVLTAFTLPASAEKRTITVRLGNGQLISITVDVPPGTPLSQIHVPGLIDNTGAVGGSTSPTTPTGPATTPSSPGGSRQPGSSGGKSKSKRKGRRKHAAAGPNGGAKAQPEGKGSGGGAQVKPNAIRQANGIPTPANPGFIDSLPGPSTATGVPNFVIEKFRVPVFLLPIYQAAGIQYGVRWEVLAAINEIETDYGRNLNVSTAGAVGWMQFLPSTWRKYGVDANRDGRKDPYNPVDAIFAAARYLKAAGYGKDVRGSIFAYNHASWYVDSVMLRARLIAGVPADVVGSLTGLTEGRFPVYAHARYADDLQEREATARVKRGQNAARVISSNAQRRGIDIYAKQGSPVIASNDGQIKRISQNRRLGRYVVLQDVYGNRYTYAHLGEVQRYYPVPKQDAISPKRAARAVRANPSDPKPTAPATGGRQPARSTRAPRQAAPSGGQASVPIKERLFAHPDLPQARDAGGLDQLLDQKTSGGAFETFKAYFSRPFGLDRRNVRLRRLRQGSQVIAGTILGRIGPGSARSASHLYFEIRPVGKGAPRIDPKPILDGWKLLEATAIYRASGRNVLYGGSDGFSIGQVLLLPKPLLERRVLSDDRIDIYPCGRQDIATHQIDRRVLATLEYLAESGLNPTVTALKCGHSFLTTSGNVSEHSSGNAVDIAKINGIPILGHQDPGGITEQTVRMLMQLQGTMRPHQIISLLDLGANTMALPDHANHIHVGFAPLFGPNNKLGRETFQVLKPGQWSDLIARLGQIEQPIVPTKPSRFAIPATRARSGRGD